MSSQHPRTVTVFDTTLRDGEQAPQNTMSVATKCALFREIDAAGVDVIEAGFPAASPADYAAVEQILATPRRAKVSLFARANPDDLACCLRAIGDARDIQVQVLVTGSEIHLEHKRRFSRAEAIAETRTAVVDLADRGIEVSLAVEDASRGSFDFLEEVVRTGVEAGASTVVMTDTVGVSTPDYFAEMIAAARRWVGPAINLAVHCHNDHGLATANTLAGLRAGADEFQGTLCGIGERAGNAALEEVVALIVTQGDRLGLRCGIDPLALYSACMAVSEAIAFPIARNKPILGQYVYATAAGIHQNGMNKHHSTYEPFDPAVFGREREIIIGRHSGRSAVQALAGQFGLEMSEDQIATAFELIIGSNEPERFNTREGMADLLAKLKGNVGAH